jgi:uncharacterized membrane protein
MVDTNNAAGEQIKGVKSQGSRRGAMAGTWVRFIIYGLLGWCAEVAWTAGAMKVSGDASGWDLRGYSYLWMLPIYGLAAWLYEPAHDRLRRRFWVVRAVIYAAGIMAVEYVTGGAIRLLTGHCPWDYSEMTRWHIHGLIRLDFFPLWAAVGLAMEPVHDFLERLTPAILRELKGKQAAQQSR